MAWDSPPGSSIMQLLVLISLLCLIAGVRCWFWDTTPEEVPPTGKNSAVVTLVMVTEGKQGYMEGALALGQSLTRVRSALPRICLVTPEVPKLFHAYLEKVGWTVKEVEAIDCNQQDASNQDDGKVGTCTKFRAWELTDYDRIIFLDSDTIVLRPIDNMALDVGTEAAISNASFAAAPEPSSSDTFNSGVMLIQPSADTFQKLIAFNEETGSAEGGDQGILNAGLCPTWNSASSDDKECARLPLAYNVDAAQFTNYQTRRTRDQSPPTVIHFMSDSKPWHVLAYEYHSYDEAREYVPENAFLHLGDQAGAHLMWRRNYFEATKLLPEREITNPGDDFITKAAKAASLNRPVESKVKKRTSKDIEMEHDPDHPDFHKLPENPSPEHVMAHIEKVDKLHTEKRNEQHRRTIEAGHNMKYEQGKKHAENAHRARKQHEKRTDFTRAQQAEAERLKKVLQAAEEDKKKDRKRKMKKRRSPFGAKNDL